MDDETKKGIEYLRGIFESGKALRLGEPQPLGQFNFWNYFVVRAYAKEWDFAISRDELSDLPGTRAYHKPANELARGLEQRFRNVSPNTFVTATGRLILLAVEWPFEAWAGRAASCLKVRVTDTLTKEFAYCFVSITHQQFLFELKENPFQIHAAIANSIRLAVDNGALPFYPSANEHPVEMQQVPLRFRTYISGDTDPSEFLKLKVLALGFKSGGKDTQVWIADPWDADYLGVETRSLQQEAEILEAEGFFVFSEDRVVASSGQKLILEARSYVRNSQAPPRAPQVASGGHKHDVFLSHASEDKLFIRELASELDKRNVTYWLDESEIKLEIVCAESSTKDLRHRVLESWS